MFFYRLSEYKETIVADSMQEQMTMDSSQLYREEVYTDRRVGSIRKLVPVNSDGEVDKSRTADFVGSAQVMTPAGALPISFRLEANNLKEAVEAFPPAAEKALEETIEELKEMQRDQASGIVVPKPGEMPQGGGSGQGGGGGIQMP